jgi:hypothetical protein
VRFRESRGSLAVQSVVASGRSRRSLGRTPGESANPAAAQGKRSRNEIFQEIPKNALCVRPSFRAILHRFTSSRRWICGIVALCVELGAVDIAHPQPSLQCCSACKANALKPSRPGPTQRIGPARGASRQLDASRANRRSGGTLPFRDVARHTRSGIAQDQVAREPCLSLKACHSPFDLPRLLEGK